jgi:hypothetical protein
MTTSLPDRLTALKEKLGRLESLSSKKQEASNLAGLRTDLGEPVQALTALTRRQGVFEDLGVPVSQPDSLASVRKRAEGIRERFRAVRSSATLKKGNAWSLLLTELSSASADVDKSLAAAWREYRSALFAGEAPAKIAGVLASTKGNLDALQAYRLTHEAFTKLFQSPPSDPTVVERAKGLAAELVRIAARFDYEVKPEVKTFLAAVQAGGAPLSLLTPEVLDWLKSGDAINSYRIRAAETQ